MCFIFLIKQHKVFSSPSDLVSVKVNEGFRRDKSGSDLYIFKDHSIVWSNELEYVKNGWGTDHGNNDSEGDAETDWTFLSNTRNGEDGKIRLRLVFDVEE